MNENTPTAVVPANSHNGLLRSAKIGALVSALLGPTLGVFELLLWEAVNSGRLPTQDLVAAFGWGVYVSMYGISIVGVPALVLGAMGGMLIQRRGSKCPRVRLKVEAAFVGALLGAALPYIKWGSKEHTVQFMIAGTISGTVCSLVVAALLFPSRSSPSSQQ